MCALARTRSARRLRSSGSRQYTTTGILAGPFPGLGSFTDGQPQGRQGAGPQRDQRRARPDTFRPQQSLHLPVLADGFAIPCDDHISKQDTTGRRTTVGVHTGHQQAGTRAGDFLQRIRQLYRLHRKAQIAAADSPFREELIGHSDDRRHGNREEPSTRAQDRHAD